MLKHLTRAIQLGASVSENNNGNCTDLVPYNADIAAKKALGLSSDSEGSTLVLVVNTDSDDSSVYTNSQLKDIRHKKPLMPREFLGAASDSATGEVSDSSIDVVTVSPPKLQFGRQVTPRKQQVVTSTSNTSPKRMSLTEKPHSTTPGPSTRKRKSLSPATHSESAAKQPKLNKTITVVDYHEIDSEDDKKLGKGKRTRPPGETPPGPASSKLAIDKDFLQQLLADQAKHSPQHEPGKCQEFKADEQRIKYFEQVLRLKLHSYWNLSAIYFRHNNKTLHLASPFPQFVEAYWPGQVMCCNVERNSVLQLERHIQRLHKPPKDFPKLSVIRLPGSSDSDAESIVPVSGEESSSPEKSKPPHGFLSDQLKFPPQHKPGEPEDFLANQESIDYFLDALALKREKYSNMIPIKDKPLSGSYSDLVLYYWPGMISCCSKVQVNCKEFQKHVTSCHLPPKNAPQPLVTDSVAVEAAKAAPRTPAAAANRNADASPSLASPRLGQRRQRQSGDPGNSQQISPPQQLGTDSPTINSPFMDEARRLRAQAMVSSSLTDLLPVLERILDMMTAITVRMRSYVVCSSPDPTIRAHTVECLEFIWSSSKSAIVRWDDLKRGAEAHALKAVQYAYGSLPVFVNWEDLKHLDMVESVVLLSKCTVKHSSSYNQFSIDAAYGLDPSATARAVVAAGSRRRSSLCVPSPALKRRRESSPLGSTSSSGSSESLARNAAAIGELCRLANVAVWQNTKARPDHKDDDGHYHAMYRYGFKKLLDLYFPADVNQLKCCGETFDRPALVFHVAERHESGCPDRTEPSISLV